MTDRIQQAFARAAAERRTALIPFVTVGYPSVAGTLEIVPALVGAGADIIEVGVPFSDPLAEGVTIQKSSQHALRQGVTPVTCMEVMSKLRASGVTAPLIPMGYYNSILAYGLERYCADAAQAGADGFIIPDLPAEESGPLREQMAKHGLSLVQMIALTSPEERIRAACEIASGFIYCVGALGVTGVRSVISDRVPGLVARIRQYTSVPVAVGFGISTPEHVREVGRFADGAIVGSALVNVIGDGPEEDAAKRAARYISGLAAGVSVE